MELVPIVTEKRPLSYLREQGRLIKAARNYAGLTQSDLAVELGLWQSDISLMESGQRDVTFWQMCQIRRLTGQCLEFFEAKI